MMKHHLMVLVALFTPACSGGTSSPDGGSDARLGTGLDAGTAPAPGDEGYVRVATALSVGQTNACAIVSGSVYCWGGVGLGADLTPRRVESLKTPATLISGGDGKKCAVVKGKLFCWAGTKQLPAVTGLPSEVTAISVGFNYDCAIAAGKAYCWGKNNLGQLGDGTRTDSEAAVEVQGLPGEPTAIGTGEFFACALVAGDVYCWGDNDEGQLGDGTQTMSTHPVKVKSLPSSVSAIAVGLIYACALADGAVYCWGYNYSGSLAREGGPGACPVPAQVAGLGPATAISASYYSTCALAGDVYCWGDGRFYNDPATHQQYSRVPVPVGFSAEVTAMKTGDAVGCAIVSGTVYCWGNNYYGLLGNGSQVSSELPVRADFSAYF